MNEIKLEIKLSFIPGLKELVLKEIGKYQELVIIDENEDSLYVDFFFNLDLIKSLRSISRAYIVARGVKYNPSYISNHKSILGYLIKLVIDNNKKNSFKTFKISCAGQNSNEVVDIKTYITNTFLLNEKDEADIKIHIIKIGDLWEFGLQVTPRPLSVREYRVMNMSGAMDPTTAYALNSLCELEKAESYLNIFSGSATLLIEAGQCYPKIKKLVGFDNDKEHLSLSIQNIKKAGLIKRIEIKEGDIFNNPDFGKFDVIVSDLPFGMVISKNEDLERLYKIFVEYSIEHLNPKGTLAIYTSEFKIFEKVVSKSDFRVIKTLNVDLITSEEQYLPTKILVLKLK